MSNYKPITDIITKKFKLETELFKVINLETDCWNWGGMKDRHGYGYINEYINHGRSLHHFVHRISFHITNPEMDISHRVVRHSCDNPSCFNPLHLLIGSQADNMRDSLDRNRAIRGEGSNFCKYSDDLIEEIRQEFAEGGTNYNRLSKKYGLSREHIRSLILGRRRSAPSISPKPKDPKPRPNPARGERVKGAILTEHQVRDIKARYTGKRGEQTRLAGEFGVSPETVRKIVIGENWKHIK